MCDDIMTVSQCARKIGRSECYVNGLISGGLLHVIHTNPRNHRKWVSVKEARQAETLHESTPKRYVRCKQAAEELGVTTVSLYRFVRIYKIRHVETRGNHCLSYAYKESDIRRAAIARAEELERKGLDEQAKMLKRKRLADERLDRMRKYLTQQDEERTQHAREQYQKNTVFPLQVQAQKDAIREAVAKLRKQKEKTR